MSEVHDRLSAAGYDLPTYQPLPADLPRVRTVVSRGMVYVAGHGPDVAGMPPLRGKVGAEIDVATGRLAATRTALNILATLNHEIELCRIARIVKVLGMVHSAPGFSDQPAVIDGASEVLLAAFGRDRGIHARSAVGMAELPMGIPVEIELVAELSDE